MHKPLILTDMNMKKQVLHLLFVAFCLSNVGCSKEDPHNEIDNKINNKIGNNENSNNESSNVNSSKWNGEETPTWLADKQFEITLPWTHESFYPNILWKVYKFTHDNNLQVAISYEKVALDYRTGIVCYDSKGQQVNFDKVEKSFKKNAILIHTNFIGEKGIIPQICEYELNDCEKLQGLQKDINQLCKETDAADRFTLEIACGYCSDGTNTYIALKHLCFDRTKKQKIKTTWFYTPTGQKLDINPSLKSWNLKVKQLGFGFFR